jgi:hypothetical protein
MENIQTVKDIPENWSFISKDSDVHELNKEYEVHSPAEYFDGDIISLYGLYEIVPGFNIPVFKVK